jgi:hypothetical protein
MCAIKKLDPSPTGNAVFFTQNDLNFFITGVREGELGRTEKEFFCSASTY